MDKWADIVERTIESLKRILDLWEKAEQTGLASLQQGTNISTRYTIFSTIYRRELRRYERYREEMKEHKAQVQDMVLEAQNLWLKNGLAAEEEVVKKIQRLEKFQLEYNNACLFNTSGHSGNSFFTYIDELVEETEKKILEHEELDLERKRKNT